MRHVEELHAHHSYCYGVSLYQVSIIEIVNISINAIVENSPGKIWIF